VNICCQIGTQVDLEGANYGLVIDYCIW